LGNIFGRKAILCGSLSFISGTDDIEKDFLMANVCAFHFVLRYRIHETKLVTENSQEIAVTLLYIYTGINDSRRCCKVTPFFILFATMEYYYLA